MDSVIDVLTKLDIIKYFICEETATRLHFHVCVYTTRSPESFRYQLKRHIQGQIYISQKDIQDQVKAVAYCMKDGKWKQRNMDVNILLQAKSISRKKEDKFDTALSNILNDVEGNQPTVLSVARQILYLHAKHNKRIYPQHIEALIRLYLSKTDTSYIERLSARIAENIEYNLG